MESIGGSLFDKDGAIAINHPDSKEISIAATSRCFYKFITGMVAEAKCVEHILPIGAAKNECFAGFGLPLVDLAVRIPPWIKVDIFDASDVIDSVHPDATAKRLPGDVPYVMALILAGVNALIRIQQLDIENCWIFSTHSNGPRIGSRRLVSLLLRIVDGASRKRSCWYSA